MMSAARAKLTKDQILKPCLFETLRQTSWNILPPSRGPIGNKLNKPIPKFSINNQNNKPETHFTTGEDQLP
jgi:hypothetical protein